MKLLAWALLLLFTAIFTVVVWFVAGGRYAFAGEAALQEIQLWVLIVAPLAMIALTFRIGFALIKHKPVEKPE